MYACVCAVAVPNEINEDRLCHDQSLQRDEWPWIGITSVTYAPYNSFEKSVMPNTHNAPPTPTRLNCRVESRVKYPDL